MNVLLFGATGMVGRGVLLECLRDPRVTRVRAVGRTPLGLSHAKLDELLHADLSRPDPMADRLAGFDACFFCLGVSSAGMTEDAYRRLTFDLTLGLARLLARLSPGMAFVYVSGAGTDATESGRTMWARVKGATENGLRALPLRAFLFRPGIIQPLEGIRSKTPAYRWFYTLSGPLLSLARALFPRHVLTTAQVGRAMIQVAADGRPGAVLEAPDIAAAAAGSGSTSNPSPGVPT